MNEQNNLSFTKLLLLIFIPSLASTALYVTIGTYWQGVPSICLFLIVFAFTLLPFELGVVLYANKKQSGKSGLNIAFTDYQKQKRWKTLLWGFALFGFAGIISFTLGEIENKLTSGLSLRLFSELGEYFNWNNFELIRQYPKGILIFTSVLYIVTNAFVFPVAEEIYFRGYLTHNLQKQGLFVPVVVSVLFSLYHLWLPFNNVFRITVFTVAYVITYKKKDIGIAIVFHCLCNLFSSVSFIVSVFS